MMELKSAEDSAVPAFVDRLEWGNTRQKMDETYSAGIHHIQDMCRIVLGSGGMTAQTCSVSLC